MSRAAWVVVSVMLCACGSTEPGSAPGAGVTDTSVATGDLVDAGFDLSSVTDDVPSDTAHAPDLGSDATTDAAEIPPTPLSVSVATAGPWTATVHGLGSAVVARVVALEVGLANKDDVKETALFDPHSPAYDLDWRPLVLCGPNQVGWDGGCQGKVTTQDGGQTRSVELTLVEGAASNVVNMRIVMEAPDGERYYGLGEYFDTPEHRGKRRAMHFVVDGAQESGYNEAHVPIPLLIGSKGWGLFVEDRRAGDFDVAATDKSRIAAAFETFPKRSLKFHLLVAERPVDILGHYVALTGKPAVPAEWVFGGLLWRDENESQAEVLADAKAIRDNDLPLSALWIDRPWATAHESFVMDPGKFPDPKVLVSTLHDTGFRLSFWSAPYIEEKLAAPYAEFTKNGWFVEPSLFLKFGRLVDLTAPGAKAAYKALIQNAINLGAEGFKLDYGEDIQVGIAGAAIGFKFANGEDQRTMHHGYAVYYHQPYFEAVGGSGKGFIIARAGTYGDQANVTTIWPGDLCNTFHKHAEVGPDPKNPAKKIVHVGGLPAAISAGLSLGTSGYPFYASDTGGYRHGRPTKEVFLRWTAYSALGSVMQTGGGDKNTNPWDFGKYNNGLGEASQFDQQTVDIYRKFARLQVQLYAYKYPTIQAAHATGRPLTSPVGFLFPEVADAPPLEYLLGDDLLVSPVTDATGKVTVTLPAGGWTDWSTGERHVGPKTFERAVALDSVALYVRDGAIVPLLRDTLDTLSPVAPSQAGTIESLAQDPGTLVIHVYPPSAAEPKRTFETLRGVTLLRDGEKFTVTAPATGTFVKYVILPHRADGTVADPKELGPAGGTVTLK